jgi:hypothetical protein
MAKVIILTTSRTDGPQNSYARSEFERLVRAAGADQTGRHELVTDPEKADLLLFVGPEQPTFQDVRRHPIRRRFIDKTFLFYSGDRIVPLMPGLYSSLRTQHYDPSWATSAFYLRVAENENINDFGPLDSARWLYVFSGSATNHPVRSRIMRLTHPRSLLKDTSAIPSAARQRDGAVGLNDKYILDYVEMLRSTKFVLCPRGVGTSTWRLFETLKAGRVPVIISDEWVPPRGPHWDDFSIRVHERDIEGIPSLLESLETKAPALGRAALNAWDVWYSRSRMFDTIVEDCLAIHSQRKSAVRVRAIPYYLKTLAPMYVRHWFLADLKRDFKSLVEVMCKC